MTGTPPARGAVAAWGCWDWAFSAFNAVATTFVFHTYLSGSAFGNPAHESELLGVFTAAAGLIIAIVAPVAGQRTDASGRHERVRDRPVRRAPRERSSSGSSA